MHPIIKKTFGGLLPEYYFRQFLFGLIFPAFLYFMTTKSPHPIPIFAVAIIVANTLLYPYSRFVYEKIIGFIMGRNTLSINIFIFIWVKLITMMLCWGLALLIAPIGLAYLYYHHSK